MITDAWQSFKDKFKQEMLKSKPVDLLDVTEEEIAAFKREDLDAYALYHPRVV